MFSRASARVAAACVSAPAPNSVAAMRYPETASSLWPSRSCRRAASRCALPRIGAGTGAAVADARDRTAPGRRHLRGAPAARGRAGSAPPARAGSARSHARARCVAPGRSFRSSRRQPSSERRKASAWRASGAWRIRVRRLAAHVVRIERRHGGERGLVGGQRGRRARRADRAPRRAGDSASASDGVGRLRLKRGHRLQMLERHRRSGAPRRACAPRRAAPALRRARALLARCSRAAASSIRQVSRLATMSCS